MLAHRFRQLDCLLTDERRWWQYQPYHHLGLAFASEVPALAECLEALSLDVPQVPRGEQPFARLREVATALCQAMDGVLCDQDGNPLPAMAMDAIAADLEQLYDVLDQRELSAGSALARRLFS